jgi:hypothetical protein
VRGRRRDLLDLQERLTADPPDTVEEVIAISGPRVRAESASGRNSDHGLHSRASNESIFGTDILRDYLAKEIGTAKRPSSCSAFNRALDTRRC